MSNQTFIKKDRISFAVDLNEVLSIAPINNNTSILLGTSNLDSNTSVVLSNQYIYADGTYLSNLPSGIGQSNLNSTITGLATFGYVSSTQLQSTVQGLGNIYISTAGGGLTPTQLTSSLVGLATVGYISSTQLQSTVQGLGNIYISTAGGGLTPTQLTSSLIGLGTVGYISSSQLFSTIAGLGTVGYISSSQLFSTVIGLVDHIELNSTTTGLGTLGYISSTQLQSTLRGLGTIGYISSTQLQSTTAGLGTIGYVSSTQLQSTTAGLGNIYLSTFNGSTNFISSTQGFISTLNVNSLIIGGGTGYVDFSYIRAILVSSIQTNTGVLFASSLRGDGSQIFNINAVSSSTLQSSIIGLGTLGYISSLNFISSLRISTGSLTASSITTLVQNVSTLNYSTIQGNIVSTNLILGTTTTQTLNPFNVGAQIGFGSNTAQGGFYAEGHFRSTFTQVIQPTLDNDGFSNVVRIEGNLSSLNTNVSSLTANSIVTSNFSSFFYGGIEKYTYISTAQLQSSITGLGTVGYISSLSLQSTVFGLVDHAELQSSIIGAGTLGYISSTQLQSTVRGIGNIYLSTFNGSTTFLSSAQGFISSLNVNSLTIGTGGGWVDFAAVRAAIVSTIQLNAGAINASSIIVNGSQIFNLNAISSLSLQSTIIGLGTLGYVSSLNFVSSLRISTGSLTTSSILTSFLTVTTIENVSTVNFSTLQGNLLSTNLILGTTTTQTFNPFNAGAQLGFGSNTAQGGFYAEGHFRSTFTQVIQPTLDNDGFSNVVLIRGITSTPQVFASTVNSVTFLSSATLNLHTGTALLGILNNAVTGRILTTNLNPIQSSNIEIGNTPLSNYFRNVYTFSTTTEVIQGQGTTGATNINSAVRVLGTLSSMNLNVSSLTGVRVSSAQFFGSSISVNGLITNSIQSLTSTVTTVDTLVPSLDNTFDLGASTNTWRHLFVGGGSIYLKNTSNINAAISFSNDNILNINKPLNLSYSSDTNAEPKIVFSKENTNSITIEATDSSWSNLPPRLLKLNNSIDLSGNNIYNATAYFINDPTIFSNYAFSFFSNVSPVNPTTYYPIYATYDLSFNFQGLNAIASDWSYFNASNVLNMCNYYIANLLQTATSHNAATNRIAKKVYFDNPADFTIGTGNFSNVLSVSPASPILYDNPYTYYNFLNCTVSFRCDGVDDDLAYFLGLSNTSIASDLSGQIYNGLYPYIENKKNFLTSNHSITFQEQFSTISWSDGEYFIPMLFIKAGTTGGTLSNIKFSMTFEPIIESFIN